MVKRRASPAEKSTERGFSAATSGTARDINRRILLSIVRTRQPVSRADLARHSGLQRSTVSLITEQLIAEQWLVEGPMGHVPRGRHPRYLRLNSARAGFIGIDVRPSGTRIGIADLQAQFRSHDRIETCREPDEFLAALGRRLKSLMRSYPEIAFEAIGVSLPGRVNTATGRLVYSANLNWRDIDVKTPLEQLTGIPVELENAANACALAELWFGRDVPPDFAVITVSEGIGAGIVLENRLVRGDSGLAGELGHVRIWPNGSPCRCGKLGCWEAMASNSAVVRYYLEGVAGRSTRRDAFPEPTFEDVLALAEQGDPKAVEALETAAGYLGAGLGMVATALAPQVIFVVGEITRAWERIAPTLLRVAREESLDGCAPRIVPLDDSLQPRLRGTVALLMQKHFAIPANHTTNGLRN